MDNLFLHYIDRGDKIWGFSFVHCGEVFNTVSLSLFCIILIGGIKFGDLVLSIVERYLIQCPFLGGSSLRGSTVCLDCGGFFNLKRFFSQ